MTHLSLCMIIKNEEQLLRQCVESVAEVLDELVIVDTGSTDRSVEIARELGARVLFQEFRDDFSEVRNASLRAATGDWILVLDADERIEADQLPQLKRLLARLDQEAPVAYTFTVPDYYAEGRRYTLRVCRLLRNLPEIYFSGRVYETVWESLRALGGTWADSGVVLRHLNYRKPLAASLRKDRLYQRLRVGEEDAAWKVLAEAPPGPGVDGDKLAAVVQSASETLGERIRKRLIERAIVEKGDVMRDA